MKKKVLSIMLLTLCVVISAWSKPVDEISALQYANDFMKKQNIQGKHRAQSLKSDELKLMYVKRNTPEEAPLFYVFGYENDGGYAIISGDDVANKLVLGYSKSGFFDSERIPCCLRKWLNEYSRQLLYVRGKPSKVKANSGNIQRTSISPLIASKWGQDSPFNNLCPAYDESYRCPAGCVATAMAQLMYYHKWPEKGIGSNSYYCRGQYLTADFGGTTYLWDKMKDIYDTDKTDPDNAVATLVYHCGVAVNMRYGVNSAASVYSNKLINYFNYSASSLHDINGDNYNLETIESIIYEELSVKRPVLISGFPEEFGDLCDGHEFICDGYADGYFHFNFGWDGHHDDYFLMSAINPANCDFSFHHEIICGIQKPGELFNLNGAQYECFPDGTAVVKTVSNLSEFVIPDYITINNKQYKISAISDGAFSKCSNLTSVSIPNGVTRIGNEAFSECSKLQTVNIPNSVITIGYKAFSGCSKLTSIIIPDGITMIPDECFSGCYKLSSVTLPNTLKYIKPYAFGWCCRLSSITIPPSVEEIDMGAFYYCYDLASIVIPKNVTSIYGNPFGLCSCLGEIQVESGNPVYDSRENCNAIIETSSNKLQAGCKNTVIPNGVITIDAGAFSLCETLKRITIPNSVTLIKEGSFEGCRGLETIIVEDDNPIYDSRNDCNAIIESSTDILLVGCKNSRIPTGVKSIANYAFKGSIDYHEAVSIDIPYGVTSIGYMAFWDCSGLTSLNIPKTVTTIGSSAFSYCSNLLSVISKMKEPFVIDNDIFSSVHSKCRLTVPFGTKDTYVAAGWDNSIFKGGIYESSFSGDANGDGEVSITDAVGVVNTILCNSSENFDEIAADVNEDGNITITDAVGIVNIILNSGGSSAPKLEVPDVEADDEETVEPE